MRKIIAAVVMCAAVGLGLIILAGYTPAPYPKSTEGLAEFHRLYGGPQAGVALGDDIYYDLNISDVVPLKIESMPFGYYATHVGYDNPRLYRIANTDDWIFEYWKDAWNSLGMSMFYRAGTKTPSPEQAAQLCVTGNFYPPPGQESKVLFSTDDMNLVHAAAQALGNGVPQHTLRLYNAGALQFRSPEYPGVAVSYHLQRDRQGQYYVLFFQTCEMPPQFLACSLPGELNQAIQEALMIK